MGFKLTHNHAALGGGAAMMACACGMAGQTAKMGVFAGLGANTNNVHPAFIALFSGLIVYGLWRRARASGVLALIAVAFLFGGMAFTPQMSMTASTMPWSASLLFGSLLYIIAGVLLVVAFWKAFPSPQPGASAVAMSGAALATGCGCCLVTGAVSGAAVTAGASAEWIKPETAMSMVGLLAIALGLYRLGGLRAALWVPAGYVLITWAPKLLKLTGDWMVAGINLRSFGAYLVTFSGTSLIMYGFVVAYALARSRQRQPGWTLGAPVAEAQV